MRNAIDAEPETPTINASQQQSEKKIAEILMQFHNAVDNNTFHDIAEQALNTLEDAEQMARCGELASKREPGGAFYRTKFWAKTAQIANSQQTNIVNKPKFNQVCNQIGIHPKRAKGFAAQGQTIAELEKVGVDTSSLRKYPPMLFQYAQRQKDRSQEYLLEALAFLKTNPEATHTQIHRNWCKKNGSIKSSLDIIKPSDWWAFSHPKWRKEDDFPGSIPGEVYANALYYYAPKIGVAVDPMAGSGMLKRVYDDREKWQKDSGFELQICLFDLNPRREFIQQHDARHPLPIKADWIFIDPPYYGQSNHLFSDELASTANYNDYLMIIRKIVRALAESLNPNGKLCIFLPKWSGLNPEDVNYDVPSNVSSIAMQSGLSWLDAAYISRARQQEAGSAIKNNNAKRARRMRSDTCVLNVFEKPNR